MEARNSSGEQSNKKRNGAHVVFLFSPQNTHYVGMGKGLYDEFSEFSAVMDSAEDIYRKLIGTSLLDSIWKDTGSIHDPEICGAGIFAIEVALAKIFQEFGVKPSTVLGHSFGEYAAAVVAEVLTLEDGMRFVIGRANLVKSRVPKGCLTVLRAGPETVREVIASFKRSNGGSMPEIAAFNGPEIVAVGGGMEMISDFEKHCGSLGIQFMRLEAVVSYAYHTSHMDPILDDLGVMAGTLTHSPPQVTFVSCSKGQELEAKDFGPEYWKALTRNAIQFSKALNHVVSNDSIFIEIGPSPKLTNLVRKNFPLHPPNVLHAMEEKEENLTSFLNCLCILSREGVTVNWNPWIRRKRSFACDRFFFKACAPGELTREIQNDLPGNLASTQVEVDVIFCSLNYKDKVNFDRGTGPFGFDLSGVIRRIGTDVTSLDVGDHVYGMNLDGGALASSIVVAQDTLAKLPSSFTLAMAASVPLSYTIAWHSLVELGRLRNPLTTVGKHRILVNLSRGWIGIPLIEIAHSFGADVYALSGSPERMAYLRSAGVKYIYDLEQDGLLFGSKIMQDTNGEGLTLVINNFEAEGPKKASLDLCCPAGSFVDISPGGRNWSRDYVYSLRPDVNYSVLDFSNGVKGQMELAWRELVHYFESGDFKPIPSKAFPVDVVKDVFDWLGEGKLGMGKPMIQISAIPAHNSKTV